MTRIDAFRRLAAPALYVAATLAQAQSTNHDSVFPDAEKFAERADNITTVDTGPVTLATALARRNSSGRGHLPSAIFVFHYAEPGMYRQQEVDAYRQALIAAKWTCAADTRHINADERRDRCSRPLGNDLFEKAVIDSRPTELTLIHSIGPEDREFRED